MRTKGGKLLWRLLLCLYLLFVVCENGIKLNTVLVSDKAVQHSSAPIYNYHLRDLHYAQLANEIWIFIGIYVIELGKTLIFFHCVMDNGLQLSTAWTPSSAELVNSYVRTFKF